MKTGLSDAEKMLFEQSYESVMRGVYIFCNDFHLAQDVTQEAFLQAFKKLNKLRDRKKFSGWVYVIAVNLAKSHYSKTKKNKEIPFRLVEDIYNYTDKKLEHTELRVDVQKILESLNNDQKNAVILYYYFDLSCEEIALHLKTNENTVKTRLYRAREKLRKILAEKEVACSE